MLLSCNLRNIFVELFRIHFELYQSLRRQLDKIDKNEAPSSKLKGTYESVSKNTFNEGNKENIWKEIDGGSPS